MKLIETIPENFEVQIQKITGDNFLKEKLESLGLYKGIKIKIIKNNKVDPLLVKVDNRRVSISKGLGLKIFVELL
ncbi:MAG: ferrous iron transport protein A [Candidatus Pacebacteria bacterium]|nr:ferrous iron transport protein A [Candidatus Paceibacterota bacterium]